jgi:hypothetical protein
MGWNKDTLQFQASPGPQNLNVVIAGHHVHLDCEWIQVASSEYSQQGLKTSPLTLGERSDEAFYRALNCGLVFVIRDLAIRDR